MKRRVYNKEFIFNDSPFKYYFLGYVLGDGCLLENSIQVDSNDGDDLAKLGKVLNANVYSKGKSNRLTIFDTDIYDYLISLGFTRRKSFEGISKPIKVPDEYKGDFLRGWIDSDGSIGRGGKPGNYAPHIRLLVGKHKHDIDTATSLISYANLKTSFLTPKGKSYHEIDFSRKTLHEFRNFVYYDGVEYYMKRKKEKFDTYYKEWNSYRHYSNARA